MRDPSKIVVIQGVTALVAVAALMMSVLTTNSRIDDIQTSRAKASYDSCQLFRRIILVAGAQSPQKDAKQRTQIFLHSTGLDNCVGYVVKLTGRMPPK